MTLNELKSFFQAKTDKEVAEKLKVSKATVHKWKNEGISEKRQAIIQIQTNGELKADISILKQLDPA